VTIDELADLIGRSTAIPAGSLVCINVKSLPFEEVSALSNMLRELRDRMPHRCEFVLVAGGDITFEQIKDKAFLAPSDHEVLEVLQKGRRASCLQDSVRLLRENFVLFRRQ